jgi:hypothetical protein
MCNFVPDVSKFSHNTARHLALHTNINIFYTKKTCIVDPGPGGSASFRRIRISLSISTNCKAKLYFFPEYFQYPGRNIENYGTYDADEQDKKMLTGKARNKIQTKF